MIRVAARPSGEASEVVRTVRIDGEQLRGDRARYHQPFGMLIDNVIARKGQLARHGDTRDVDPGVHAKSGCVRLADRVRNRIERLRCGARIVNRLHEQSVEAGRCGRCHHPADGFFGSEAGPAHPERANLIARTLRVKPYDVRRQDSEERG